MNTTDNYATRCTCPIFDGEQAVSIACLVHGYPDFPRDSVAIDLELFSTALAFAISVIKCGEPWTDTCEKTFSAAFVAVKTLRAREVKLNGWLNERESQLAKSRHEVNQARRSAEAAEARVVEFEAEKRAPVQGYSAGIPWSMHLRAYDVYCKRFSPQPALINLEKRNCRGGFGTEELDEFIPGWRDELSKTVQLLRRAEADQARVVALEGALEALANSQDFIENGLARIAARAILSATPGDALERARATRHFIDLTRLLLKRHHLVLTPPSSGSGRKSIGEWREALTALDALGKDSPQI